MGTNNSTERNIDESGISIRMQTERTRNRNRKGSKLYITNVHQIRCRGCLSLLLVANIQSDKREETIYFMGCLRAHTKLDCKFKTFCNDKKKS